MPATSPTVAESGRGRRLAAAFYRLMRRGRSSAPTGLTHPEFPDLEPRQLTMAMPGAAARRIELPEVPAGYTCRSYRPGDEASWVELLAIDFTTWDRQRFDEFMAAPERRAGSRVIERKGEIVAATFASRVSSQPLSGAVDYVACHPAHRGRKLGLITCGTVTRRLGETGYESIRLLTDDWRLPAIKVYFHLGFSPVVDRIDMPVRWEAVRRQLDLH